MGARADEVAACCVCAASSHPLVAGCGGWDETPTSRRATRSPFHIAQANGVQQQLRNPLTMAKAETSAKDPATATPALSARRRHCAGSAPPAAQANAAARGARLLLALIRHTDADETRRLSVFTPALSSRRCSRSSPRTRGRALIRLSKDPDEVVTALEAYGTDSCLSRHAGSTRRCTASLEAAQVQHLEDLSSSLEHPAVAVSERRAADVPKLQHGLGCLRQLRRSDIHRPAGGRSAYKHARTRHFRCLRRARAEPLADNVAADLAPKRCGHRPLTKWLVDVYVEQRRAGGVRPGSQEGERGSRRLRP